MFSSIVKEKSTDTKFISETNEAELRITELIYRMDVSLKITAGLWNNKMAARSERKVK